MESTSAAAQRPSSVCIAPSSPFATRLKEASGQLICRLHSSWINHGNKEMYHKIS